MMGDVVREETKRRGLKVNAINTASVMKDLRRKGGDAAIAKLCLQTVREGSTERVIVDGIRSTAEVDEFRKAASVIVIAVHASPKRRYALLKKRGRGDDPLTYEMFLKRDERELGVGIGDAIALADEVVVNERVTPEGLSGQLAEVVDRWLAPDAP